MANEIKKVDIIFESNADQTAKEINSLNSTIDDTAKATDRVTDSSKKFTKAQESTLHSVQANGGAMGLLNDVTGGLAMTFKDAYEASSLFEGGMGKMLTAVKSFSTGAKAAIAATGIGLLLVAVGTIATYWDDIKGAVDGVTGSLRKQAAEAQKSVDAETKKLATLNSQDEILKLQGKSEKEINDLKIKQTGETIKALKAQIISQEAIKKAQIDAATRNRDILSGILKFISLPITGLLKTIDLIGQSLGKNLNLMKSFDTIAEFVFDPKEVEKKGNETIEETKKQLLELENTQAGYINANQKMADDAAKEAADKRKAAADKEAAEAKKEAERLLKIAEDKYKGLSDLADKFNKEVADLNAQTAQEQLDLAKKRDQAEFDSKKLSDAQLKLLTKEQQADYARDILQGQADLDEKYRIKQKELDEQTKKDRLAFLDSFKLQEKTFNDAKTIEEINAIGKANEDKLLKEKEANIKIAIEKGLSAEQIRVIEEFYAGKTKENDKAVFDAKDKLRKADTANAKAWLSAGANTLSQATELLGEHTDAGKATSIAATTIATYQSATAAYNSLAGIPIVGPALGAVAAGVAVAAGIANVKKILAVKVPGGKGGGAATSQPTVTPPAAAPNVSFVASSDNRISDSINRQTTDQPPIKAYVVSQDMTNAQQLDRNLRTSNSIG